MTSSNTESIKECYTDYPDKENNILIKGLLNKVKPTENFLKLFNDNNINEYYISYHPYCIKCGKYNKKKNKITNNIKKRYYNKNGKSNRKFKKSKSRPKKNTIKCNNKYSKKRYSRIRKKSNKT